MIKLRRVGCGGHVERMGGKRNKNRVLGGKTRIKETTRRVNMWVGG
jgi:hypothetical protein